MKNRKEVKPAMVRSIDNKVEVKFTITRGEALALQHALEDYAYRSMVAVDVHCYLMNAFSEAGIDLG